MNQELIRIVDNIARDKNIDKESLFIDLEEAMVSAVRKHFGEPESNIVVHIDRNTGQVTASKDDEPIDIRRLRPSRHRQPPGRALDLEHTCRRRVPHGAAGPGRRRLCHARRLGRIPAQTAKQVMIQKIRADERDSIYAEFVQRKGEIISGSVVRYEGGTLIANLSHWAEGFMPKNEQIMGQSHRPSERIRCLILDVKETSNQVKIILSRTHPDFIRRLFELEVPEIAENIIEIRALAREAGYRTKVAVISLDEKVDPVGACVGVRGSRIKNIVEELGGEKIDIVRWNESSQVLVANALMPAKVSEIALCFELGKATVVVDEDQLSLAIGKHGQNVRLAARLTGWDIDILMPEEYNQGIERLANCVKNVKSADDTLVDKLIALGVISVLDLDDVGAEPLINELNINSETAKNLVAAASEETKRLAAESKEQDKEKESAKQAEAADNEEKAEDKQ